MLTAIATIQYGGPIDVVIPVVMGLVIAWLSLWTIREGAIGIRNCFAPRYYMERRQPWAFHLAWFKPRRLWPERFNGFVAAIMGTMGLGLAAVFFGIAVSVILD